MCLVIFATIEPPPANHSNSQLKTLLKMRRNFQAGARFLSSTFFWYDIFEKFYKGHLGGSWSRAPANFQENVLSIKVAIII